jgi:hypothetical protein
VHRKAGDFAHGFPQVLAQITAILYFLQYLKNNVTIFYMERIVKAVNSKDPLGFLRENKEFLAEQFGVLDIALFGSRAKNSHKKDSDLDLLVELKHKSKTFDNYMDLKFFFEDHFKMKVDLVLKDSIRPELKKIILAEAVHA